ncbi:MAG: hypothetical protein N2321_02985 [Melioribacteraceae bacterium]|nr:hypothetical protein [Melioribacteraceae bacterium]
MLKKLSDKNFFLLVLLYLISSLIRLKINFSTEYFPGNNGAFYLLLNRNLIESGDLVFRDFPLIFYIQSFFASLLIKFNLLNINQAIDYVSRVFDSFVPPLSIIPAFLITKKVIKSNGISVYLISGLSIFHFYFFVLISDFQKNSLGIFLLLWLLYFLIILNENFNHKNFLYVFLFFILNGLTHFGCFGVAIVLILIYTIINAYYKLSDKKYLKLFIISFLIIIFSFGLVYSIHSFRFYSMIEIIKNLFVNPVIIKIIEKEPVITQLDLFHILITNILSIFVFVLLIKNKDVALKNYLLTLAALTLLLSSPMINYEIAQRIYFISYIFIIPLIAFIYQTLNKNIYKRLIIFSIVVLIIISVNINYTKPVYSNMNKNLYKELITLKNNFQQDKRSLIISRHGLEFWLMWILRVDAIRSDEVNEKYWEWYDEIYILVQKKFKPPFGPSGSNNTNFPEPKIPENSTLIVSNDYYDFYKIISKPKDISIFKERL